MSGESFKFFSSIKGDFRMVSFLGEPPYPPTNLQPPQIGFQTHIYPPNTPQDILSSPNFPPNISGDFPYPSMPIPLIPFSVQNDPSFNLISHELDVNQIGHQTKNEFDEKGDTTDGTSNSSDEIRIINKGFDIVSNKTLIGKKIFQNYFGQINGVSGGRKCTVSALYFEFKFNFCISNA